MKKFNAIWLIALLLLAVAELSACGKVSRTEPIEGSGYPHTYPRR